MANNKTNNKKEKTTKNKKVFPKPKKVEEEVFDEVVSDSIEEKKEEEPIVFTEPENKEEIAEIVEIVEVQDEVILENDTFNIEAETLQKEEKVPVTKKNTRILNEESSQYETLPLKPMKRDPKNIFFNVKKKIKMIFE